MYPLELAPETLPLPETDDHSIVLVTGNGLRHKRFAYRIQQAFGEQVVGWFELDAGVSTAAGGGNTTADRGQRERRGRLTGLRRGNLGARVRARLHARNTEKQLRKYYAAQQQADLDIFGAAIDSLKQFALTPPIRIHPTEVATTAFLARLETLNPYFFLTLGGPLYKKPVLDTVRGVAINQHAGHSPLLRGSNTTQWALYHRQLDHVSATVHITTTGADAGPILRRSSPCLFPTDSVNHVFARVVALGTELMIESVREIIADKGVTVFPQPPGSGRTYLSQELGAILPAIQRDFAAGWLPAELQRQRQF